MHETIEEEAIDVVIEVYVVFGDFDVFVWGAREKDRMFGHFGGMRGVVDRGEY